MIHRAPVAIADQRQSGCRLVAEREEALEPGPGAVAALADTDELAGNPVGVGNDHFPRAHSGEAVEATDGSAYERAGVNDGCGH